MFKPRRYPHRAVGWHQPAPLRGGDLHGPACCVHQLRLAVHMGVEPDALLVAARDQMHAIADSALAVQDVGEWRFSDSHWRHPVRTRTYNLIQKMRGFDP